MQIPSFSGGLVAGRISAVDMDFFFGELALFTACVCSSCLGGNGALSQMQTPHRQRFAPARSSRNLDAYCA
jgi:hypothetical protein